MKKMLRLGLVPLTALTLAAVVNAPLVKAEETVDINTEVTYTPLDDQTSPANDSSLVDQRSAEETPPENQQQPKMITVEVVKKTVDGSILETSTDVRTMHPEEWYVTFAGFIPGYRLIGNSSFELTYDQVQDGDRLLVEFVYQPDENAQEKTITVERVAKTEDGTVLETSTNNFIFIPGDFSSSFTYTANHIAGYRLSHYTRQVVTYDEVENGDKVVLEAIYKPVVSDKLDEDALTFSVKPIDTNLNPLPLEFKTATIYPGEFFFASIKNAPVYPGYEFRGHLFIPTYDIIKEAITERGSYILPVIYSPVEPEGKGPETIEPTPDVPRPNRVIVHEERQDENGKVILSQTHQVYLLEGEKDFTLSYDPQTEELINGEGAVVSYGKFADDTEVHFITRRIKPKADNPPAPQPKSEDSAPKEELKDKTITIIEERQDEEGRVIFKKEHVFNLKPHQEEQLPLDQTLDQLIRGSNIASWDAYDDGAVIYFTTRRRPKADKPDTTLDDLKKDQQTPEVKPNPVPTPKPEDKPTPTPVPKDLSADRNKLLLSLDESKLTDEQKGKLAEKIAFAETEKDLADLKAELVTLVKAVEKSTEKPADKPMTGKTEVKAPTPATTAKPVANTPAKSDKPALPATGDGARLGLLAAGFSLLLLGLGLAKARKHN